MKQWFRRLFCRHRNMTLTTTGHAGISPRGAQFRAILPAVEVKCQACGEFWHAELDATAALTAALE
jgi:RNase P subunit RPR2